LSITIDGQQALVSLATHLSSNDKPESVTNRERSGSKPAVSSFQAAASAQGRQFAEQCDFLLKNSGFVLGRASLSVAEIGIEIDREATSPGGTTIWFEYKGSLQGKRPGLRRTDTLKKAIANGALLQAAPASPPYVVLTSHLPNEGAGFEMLRAALKLGLLSDVICIYDTAGTTRLLTL